MHSKNTLFRPGAHSAQLGTDHLGDKIIGYLIKDKPKAINKHFFRFLVVFFIANVTTKKWLIQIDTNLRLRII